MSGTGTIISKKEIDAWLSNHGLYRKNIPRDETSLFRAVSDQIYLTQARHEKVRLECYEFTKANYESLKCYIKTGDKIEVYLKKLLNHTIVAGLQEIQIISKRFERDFIVYNGLNFTIENITNFGFEKTIQVCQLDKIHYDAVMNEDSVEIAGFCQGILYKLLYKKVLKYENVDAVVQNMLYRHPDPDCYAESYEPKPEDLDLPFPYKVAKALDETQYRNIEYDSWTDVRRDLRMKDWYFGDDDLKPGAKCLFQAKHRLEVCFIQKLNDDEGYIYNQDRGRFMSARRSDLKPMPDARAWPLPERKSKRRNNQWRPNRNALRQIGPNESASSNTTKPLYENFSDTVSFAESFQPSFANLHTSTPNEMITPSDNTNNDNDSFPGNINESESFVTNNNDSESFVTNNNDSESFVTNNNDSESFVTNINDSDSFVTNRYDDDGSTVNNEASLDDENNNFVYSNDSYNNFDEYHHPAEQFFADGEQNNKMHVSQYWYQVKYYNRVRMFRGQYCQGTCNMSCPYLNQYPSVGPACCPFDQSAQDNNYNCVQKVCRMGPAPHQFTQSQPYAPVCSCSLPPQYYGPVSPPYLPQPPFGPVPPGTQPRPLYRPRRPMDPRFPTMPPQGQMYPPPFGPVPTSQRGPTFPPPFCPVPTSQLRPICPPPFCPVPTSQLGPTFPPPFGPVPTSQLRPICPPPFCPVPTSPQGPRCPPPFYPVPTSAQGPMCPPTFNPVSTLPQRPMYLPVCPYCPAPILPPVCPYCCPVPTSPPGPLYSPVCPYCCPVPTSPPGPLYPPVCPCCPVPTSPPGPMYPRFCPVPTSLPALMEPPCFPIDPVDDNVQY